MDENHIRPVSRHCLNRRPIRKTKKTTGHPKQSRTLGAARYDDMAATAVRHAITEVFIAANNEPTWSYASSVEMLDAIWRQINAHPAQGSPSFGALLRQRRVRLLVGLVADVSGDVVSQDVANLHSPFLGESVNYRRVPLLLAATENRNENALHITEERWQIGRRKFSLPGRSWVRGPYLVIAAIDGETSFTLRARLWPVWLAPSLSSFAVVRSDYERVTLAAVHACGGVGFTPIHLAQLGQLQDAFGHRWAGNLRSYPYLPDILLLPIASERIAVLEVFGLCRLKKYVEAKSRKERTLKDAQISGTFDLFAIQTRELRQHQLHGSILACVKDWFATRRARLATSATK